MANIKSIEITGLIPFDANQSDDLLKELGKISLLQSLDFSLSQGDMVPNEHGGRTTRYRFSLTGEEAVSYKWIDRFCDLIESAGGMIERKYSSDLEY